MPYLSKYHLSEHRASVLLGPVADRELEVRAEARLDAFPSGGRAARRVREPVEQAPPRVVEQLGVERALAREVLVEDRLRDAGPFRDLVHRRLVEAGVREQLARDRQQLLAALVGRKSSGRHTLDLSGIT